MIVNRGLYINIHTDNKDFRWCCVISFEKFKGDNIKFFYMRVETEMKMEDICFFRSKYLHHVVSALKKGKKGLIVLTNLKEH